MPLLTPEFDASLVCRAFSNGLSVGNPEDVEDAGSVAGSVGSSEAAPPASLARRGSAESAGRPVSPPVPVPQSGGSPELSTEGGPPIRKLAEAQLPSDPAYATRRLQSATAAPTRD